MGISPFQVGQLLPILQVTIKDDSGNPLPLTGATLSGVLRNISTNVDTALTGTWTITNAAGGVCTYAWVTGDTSTPGDYNILITATFSGLPEYADPIPFLILNR